MKTKPCKCCYPGSPLDQCQRPAGHDGAHMRKARENSRMWARDETMWARDETMIWTLSWVPRDPDRAVAQACAERARQRAGSVIPGVSAVDLLDLLALEA